MEKFSLKACRVNAKLSRVFVAEHIGVSVSTIKSWELGITEPRLNQFMALCKLYNVSPDSIKVSDDTKKFAQ